MKVSNRELNSANNGSSRKERNSTKLLHEGKAKKVYRWKTGENVVLEFKDSLTAGDGTKKGKFDGKGRINAQVSSIFFQLLEKHGLNTHFIEQIDDTKLLCKKVDIIPLEVVVRNRSAGSFSKRYGLDEGVKLDKPIVEFFLKDDDLHDPLMTERTAVIMNIINERDLSFIKTVALQVNSVLKAFLSNIDMILIDYKLEFGVDSTGRILIADEITQDTIRIWDRITGEKKDKDRFRRDLGRVSETYSDFLANLQPLKDIDDFLYPLTFETELMINLKVGIKDPVGDITKRSLHQLGYKTVTDVRVGKVMTVTRSGSLNFHELENLQAMICKLLSNPLVETTEYRFRIV
ncbi:MAG: phosphoribosylaminoimidazolesuccinocarboxamide synthase [Candidatus Hodarchaeales archaeon]